MKIFHERSIEFQLKVVVGLLGDNADAALYARIQETLCTVLQKHSGKARLKTKFPAPWMREGIRYDTDTKIFRKHNLSLAMEATEKLTKYKCKQHNFIAELLYDKPKSALCYPKNKGSDVKLKLEQDIHFNNCKFCASGSLFLKGCRTVHPHVADFSALFPGIEQIAAPDTPLSPVSHWSETVCGKMVTSWRDITLEWDLVNRRDYQTHELLESELSFKIIKSMKDPWDYRLLELASAVYLDLKASGIFRQHPPIFYFDDPVSSVEIQPG